MDLDGVEPRRTLWALGEVWWQDATGTACRVPATIEDTSASGACVRVKAPIEVGSDLTVKWQREQFSGVARNRRREGSEFLVGIQRHKGDSGSRSTPPVKASSQAGVPPSPAPIAKALEPLPAVAENHPAPVPTVSDGTTPPVNAAVLTSGANAEPSTREERPRDKMLAASSERQVSPPRASVPAEKPVALSPVLTMGRPLPGLATSQYAVPPAPASRVEAPPNSSPALHERRFMQSTPLFQKLWRHQPDPTDGPDQATPTEVPVNKSDTNPEAMTGPQSELLSCEDIYRASGILGVGSKYDIAKIVEMLNSKHIRELPKEVRRASVLMALDAAGTSVDEVLNDASRRQHALNSYEGGQQKQFEQFEADKTRENAQIQLEIERVTARYAERIQQNLDQIAREKEAFRTWQASKEAESQRIGDAVALCGKQPMVEPPVETTNALAKGAAASQTAASTSAAPADVKSPAIPIR